MEIYQVKKLRVSDAPIRVCVPASKSILNRALILSAIGNGKINLKCGSYAEDTRSLLSCLTALGIQIRKTNEGFEIIGCSGNIPNKTAELNVMSAGTTARFLTTLLAFCGGNYLFHSSEQMEKRPMEHLRLLEKLGVTFEFLKERYHFPFRMISNGVNTNCITIDTDESTQYASGILLASSVLQSPLTLTLTGSRIHGSYIAMTVAMMQSYQIPITQVGNTITVSAPTHTLKEYNVEPDISGACYFYALSLLCGAKVIVEGVRKYNLQGDSAFFKLLESRGVKFIEQSDGLLADGSGICEYVGFEENMNDFSDQTLTVAALAAFAKTPSVLKNVGHIRAQECDRIHAICSNLNALGVPAYESGNDVIIQPSPVKGGLIHTFNDHRVAMAFTLVGLKTGNIQIENPNCCRKTFENYFELIENLTKE